MGTSTYLGHIKFFFNSLGGEDFIAILHYPRFFGCPPHVRLGHAAFDGSITETVDRYPHLHR